MLHSSRSTLLYKTQCGHVQKGFRWSSHPQVNRGGYYQVIYIPFYRHYTVYNTNYSVMVAYHINTIAGSSFELWVYSLVYWVPNMWSLERLFWNVMYLAARVVCLHFSEIDT